MAHTFKNIKVWQKAHELVLEIYKLTKAFPASKRYGLTSQLRRSATSIATNIVEGYKRRIDNVSRRNWTYAVWFTKKLKAYSLKLIAKGGSHVSKNHNFGIFPFLDASHFL